MARILAVKNWGTFQHYSDRRPPWIKLYVALLDDLEYLDMSDGAQAGLIRIWLLAARLGHPLPNNPKLIEQRAGVKQRHLREIIAHGWLLEQDEHSATKDASSGASTDASNDASNDASTLTRARERASAPSREGEVERETELPLPATSRVREALTAEHHRAALDTALTRAGRSPLSLVYELTLLAEGGERIGAGRQEAHGWPVVGEALHALAVAGGPITPNALRGFIRGLAPRDSAPPRRRTTLDDADTAIREGYERLERQRLAPAAEVPHGL